MILIAGCLYLPQHIAFLITRGWFYYQGDPVSKDAVSSSVAESVSGVAGQRFRDIVETARAQATSASDAVTATAVGEL